MTDFIITSAEFDDMLRTRVYVTFIDYDEFDGPLNIKRGDSFSNTQKASDFLGCSYDEVAACFCFNKMAHGSWSVATVRGVDFSLQSEMERLGIRPPMLDPIAGKRRYKKRSPEEKEWFARIEMNRARRRMLAAQHEIILRDQTARSRKG